MASRVRAAGLEQASLGCPIWGYEPDGVLRALCHAGSNLVPVNADDGAIGAWAEFAGPQRMCASIIGPSSVAMALWHRLADRWGPTWAETRNVRPHQPVMAITSPAVGCARPPGPPGDPRPVGRLHRRGGEDVHRGDRRVARAGEPGGLPVLRAPADHLGASVRDLRGRPGDLQGRSRLGVGVGLPGAGRVARPGAPRPGPGRSRHGCGRPAGPDDGAHRLALRQRLQPTRPGPPMPGSAFSRSASSPPFTISPGSRTVLRSELLSSSRVRTTKKRVVLTWSSRQDRAGPTDARRGVRLAHGPALGLLCDFLPAFARS